MSPHSNRSKNSPKAGREPRAAELTAAREQAGLTQSQAADLIYTSPRNLQNWEQGSDGRSMPASAFELFMLKTGQFIPEDLLVPSDGSSPVRLKLRLGNGAITEFSIPQPNFAALVSRLAPYIPPKR